MLRTILIDDEPQCLTSLSQELALHCPEEQIVSSQSSSKEGLKDIHREQPDLDYLDIDMVVELLLSRKPAMTHVCLTGRNAKPELIEAADLVTEMSLVKHPFKEGVKAQKGVEF